MELTGVVHCNDACFGISRLKTRVLTNFTGSIPPQEKPNLVSQMDVSCRFSWHFGVTVFRIAPTHYSLYIYIYIVFWFVDVSTLFVLITIVTILYSLKSGWWFGTGILWLSIYWECHHHPNWLSLHHFFRGVAKNHQPDNILYIYTICHNPII